MPETLSEIFELILDYAEEEASAGTSSSPSETRILTRKQQKTVGILRKFTSSEQNPEQKEEISFQELSQHFLDDWDVANSKSIAVQQLSTLLNLPHIQAVLWAAQEVSAGRYGPQLPDVPFEVDEDDGVAVKIVRIVRRGEPLGATIKCEKGKVYVARIMANGVADRSGCIQDGDRVLEVNGVTVADKEPREIVNILDKCDNGIITFKLIPAEVNQKLKQKKSTHRYVRALFDYDPWQDRRHPCPEAAISFRAGDILEVMDEKDQYWWQTRKIGFGALARRKESHDEDGNRDEIKKVGLVPSEWLQWKSQDENLENETSEDFQEFLENPTERFYENVFRWRNKRKRRRIVVLLGAPGVGRNEIRRQFFKIFADRFTNAIPHTSRAPRPNESDGVNYYFTTRHEMEKMIERKEMLEYGEFRENLYGTALKSVRRAAENGTVLLTPHPLAVENIRTAEFSPIVIFVQPPEFGEFKHTRELHRAQTTRSHSAASSSNISQNTISGRAFSDSEIRQIIENSAQMEQKYRGFCDAIIRNTDLDTTVNELTGLIYQLESKATWMPTKWANEIGE